MVPCSCAWNSWDECNKVLALAFLLFLFGFALPFSVFMSYLERRRHKNL
jgi:hypothetical protein